MNCQSFLNELHEYVEGSLAPDRRRVAEEHLAGCANCRRLLEQEQRVAQGLSQGFQQGVGHLALPADFQERLMAELRHEAEGKVTPPHDSPEASWVRLAWPVAIAASVLFTSFRLSYFFPGAASGTAAQSGSAIIQPDISVHLVYCTPEHTFRTEGNQVVDAVSCEQQTVDMTFYPVARKPL